MLQFLICLLRFFVLLGSVLVSCFMQRSNRLADGKYLWQIYYKQSLFMILLAQLFGMNGIVISQPITENLTVVVLFKI